MPRLANAPDESPPGGRSLPRIALSVLRPWRHVPLSRHGPTSVAMNLEIDDDVLTELRRAQALAADGHLAEALNAYEALLARLVERPYQAAAVAHMYALIVDDPHQKLQVNENALRFAESVPDDGFPPPLRATLYANIGYSHRELGDPDEARAWYLRAQQAADALDDDDYGRMMRAGIDNELRNLD